MAVGEALHEVEGQVEARGHPAGRHEVAVVDKARVDDLRPGGAQVVDREAMRRRSPAGGEAGGGEQHGARTDGADDRAARVGVREQARKVPAVDLGADAVALEPAAAGDKQDVRGLGRPPVDHDARPVRGRDRRRAVGADELGVDRRPVVGRRAEDLVGRDRVHLVKPVEEHDLDVRHGLG